jgi:type VI secretion system protein ImpM
MPGPAAFLFGKLPAHGDFVVRGLDASAVRAWDDWASGRLQALHAACGDGFEAAHDAAPPWRFITAGGEFGRGWLAGALAPSVDGAGRRYLVVLGVQGLSPAWASVMGVAIADALEQLIYRAIASGLTADAVVTQIQALLADIEASSARVADGLAPHPSQTGAWWSDPKAGPLLGVQPPEQVLGPESVQPNGESRS